MARTIHPTPRHLDDPLKILGFTGSEIAMLMIGLGLLRLSWGNLPPLPVWVNLILYPAIAAGPLMLLRISTTMGYGPRRLARLLWSAATGPREYLPGRPVDGPTELLLVDDRYQHEEEPADG